MAYVLIIDDDEDFASSITTALQSAGHEVLVELDTESGLKSMEARRPDLLILDVMFPEELSGGFELARKISLHSEKLKGIPILMLTAVNTKLPLGFGPRDIDDTWLPVSDFVEKPVDLDVLQGKVAALLAKAADA